MSPGALLPAGYALAQNYPNPLDPSTTIRFALPELSRVTLFDYNLLGQEVVKLVYAEYSAGYHTVRWHGKGRRGTNVATGIYFV